MSRSGSLWAIRNANAVHEHRERVVVSVRSDSSLTKVCYCLSF